jgi:hypothetical protein
MDAVVFVILLRDLDGWERREVRPDDGGDLTPSTAG